MNEQMCKLDDIRDRLLNVINGTQPSIVKQTQTQTDSIFIQEAQ